MFTISEKKPVGEVVVFTIVGMHCTSCALLIDGALEDTAGVLEATTNYAKGKVVIEYDSKKITRAELAAVITQQGYQVVTT